MTDQPVNTMPLPDDSRARVWLAEYRFRAARDQDEAVTLATSQALREVPDAAVKVMRVRRTPTGRYVVVLKRDRTPCAHRETYDGSGVCYLCGAVLDPSAAGFLADADAALAANDVDALAEALVNLTAEPDHMPASHLDLCAGCVSPEYAGEHAPRHFATAPALIEQRRPAAAEPTDPEARWPNHTPLRGGGCSRLDACTCALAAGRHCANCGRPIFTEESRHGSHTGHVGMRERLAALERDRAADPWIEENRRRYAPAVPTLYWSAQGEVACGIHAPYAGSDTWNAGRWSAMSTADREAWHVENGAEPICETARYGAAGAANCGERAGRCFTDG